MVVVGFKLRARHNQHVGKPLFRVELTVTMFVFASFIYPCFRKPASDGQPAALQVSGGLPAHGIVEAARGLVVGTWRQDCDGVCKSKQGRDEPFENLEATKNPLSGRST